LSRLPVAPVFVPVNGDAPDLAVELARLNRLLAGQPVDLCLAGIGENGHLAFNDPPCDFEVDAPYIVVDLDKACRQQQLGEGWFPNLDAVPRQAISMSIRQIMRSACLVLTVPDQRKAVAVRRALEGPVDNRCPASIVQRHGNCVVFLDAAGASLLQARPAAGS
ncbi:MAG: 6-phosphogluconolactonase, partial [Rhodoferax sp.]|nr:6-phosphogluconolactonase [Rhodoferax sp.]